MSSTRVTSTLGGSTECWRQTGSTNVAADRKSDLCQCGPAKVFESLHVKPRLGRFLAPHTHPDSPAPDACMGCARAEPDNQSRAVRARQSEPGGQSREGRRAGEWIARARGVRIVLSPELTGGGFSSVPLAVSEDDKPRSDDSRETLGSRADERSFHEREPKALPCTAVPLPGRRARATTPPRRAPK